MSSPAPTIADQFASVFGQARRVPVWVLVAYLVLHVILAHVLLADSLREAFALRLFVSTGGLVTYTAVTFFLKSALLIGGLVLVFGRLRPADLGLRLGQAATAVFVVLLGWTLLQLVIAIVGTIGGGAPELNERIFSYPWKVTAGALIESAAAGAFFEELAYRGFLLPQLYLIARRLWPGCEMKAIVASLIGTQVFFALNHVPAGLELTSSAVGLAGYLMYIALGGLLFAMIYVVTGNLLVSIGVHALINYPAPLFSSAIDPSLLCLVGAVLLVAVWGKKRSAAASAPGVWVQEPGRLSLARG